MRSWFPFSENALYSWTMAAGIPDYALFRPSWIRVGPSKLALIAVNATDLSAITHFNSPCSNIISIARVLCFSVKYELNYIYIRSKYLGREADRE
jgi:hypothetical protein